MSASAPGSDPGPQPARPLRAIPRSRAFWELKAEQLMNRVFAPEDPIDLAVQPDADPSPGLVPVDVDPSVSSAPPARNPEASAATVPSARILSAVGTAGAATASGTGEVPGRAPASRPPGSSGSRQRPSASGPAGLSGLWPRPDERLVLIGTLCGVCLVSVIGSLFYLRHWTHLQQTISQERNLLLLERLRSLGPANPSPVPGPEPAAPVLPSPASSSPTAAEGLPPPPPQEAWIEQLSSLPQPPSRPARVLTVPASPRLASEPAASPPRTPLGASPLRSSSSSRAGTAGPAAAPAIPLPQLVGVVAGGGRAPSAIFLVGGSSMSVASGELIGASGWRLRSAEGETALIERGGDLRQVSIASGNGF